jgi:2,4-dienoyl-CoA reductase-like NADH-dependent reductase (Old Yellow Enzyme family)
LERIADLVRRNGATPGIQLMHSGGKARGRAPWEEQTYIEDQEVTDCDPADWYRMGPSGIALDGASSSGPKPREMSTDDIHRVQKAFIDAAVRADQVGYEVVEIHGAHGYLIHTFLSELTNQRQDEYGGSFNNRIRFLMEIVEGVRKVWPERKPIIVRLSLLDGTSWSMEDSIELVKRLGHAGVDVIDCSAGGLTSAVHPTGTGNAITTPTVYAYQAAAAGRIKRETGILTQAVGLIVHAHHAEAIIARGVADLVAVGREALFNPNWAIDAAHKLGADPDYSKLPHHQGYWLQRREARMEDFLPSTHDTEKVAPIPD